MFLVYLNFNGKDTSHLHASKINYHHHYHYRHLFTPIMCVVNK